MADTAAMQAGSDLGSGCGGPADQPTAYNFTFGCAPQRGFFVGRGPALEGDLFVFASAYAQGRARCRRRRIALPGPPMLVLMFVVLYFVIRPQMKKQKEHKAMIEALAKGDEVVITSGG